ncbi:MULTISPECIES: hypothetical protein [unclassified Brevundimonas]|uniref:hypothetical protein n=1 Tax=unclassified Brevundimonas TaxID=2622653 RepID=UPI0025C68F2B|nr:MULTISPECIES: hypothetical protein [unclassified Brevundimonas]
MSQDPVADIQGDIAYMKSLAAEGRDAPVLVGPILVAAGLWFGAATVGQWLIALGMIPLTGWGVMWMWVGAGIGFAALLYVLIRRIDAAAGSRTKDNTAIGAAWSACGYTIFGMWLVLMAFCFSTGNWSPMALMPSIVMIAYGAAWFIAGQVAGRGWMLLTGLVSFLGAAALAWFAFTHWTYAIYLVLMVLVALAPGLHLMKLAARTRH